MFSRVVCCWLNGRPGRNPKWIDARSFIQDFRDVTAFLEHGHTEMLILDRYGAAALQGHATRFALDCGTRSHCRVFADFKTASVTWSVAKASLKVGAGA